MRTMNKLERLIVLYIVYRMINQCDKFYGFKGWTWKQMKSTLYYYEDDVRCESNPMTLIDYSKFLDYCTMRIYRERERLNIMRDIVIGVKEEHHLDLFMDMYY